MIYFWDPGLRSFINKYHPRHAFVINLGFKDSLTLGNTEIHFLPYTDLVTEAIPGFPESI